MPARKLPITMSLTLAMTVCFLAQPAWSLTWAQCARQDAAWYKTTEAIRIADDVLLYQANNGGWDKNDMDMTRELSDAQKAELLKQKDHRCSIDNGATHSQMRYLAKVYAATGDQKYKDGFLRGVNYLLTAQYPNGGWPQFFPLRQGYYTHITFNDGAMIGVMSVLDDVANRRPPYDLADEALRAKIQAALKKGVECILKCQVVQNGRKTAWPQQCDEVTFKPAKARAYELPSLGGAESSGIVSYLMAMDKPSPEVMEAVESAVKWFEEVKIVGFNMVIVKDENSPKGTDKRMVADPNAAPLWARYYELGTNRPMFVDRDGLPKYSFAEMSYERRNGYSWLGRWPQKVLNEYPAWRQKWVAKK
jgi:PelA/Pel-15E family pectate lyase